VIVQTGALELSILQTETERANQVELSAGIGAKPDHVAGVRRDLGLVKHDMKHGLAAYG
jgi:hypothetical protein